MAGQERFVWWFWAAAAVALVGSLLPFAAGGASSRLAPVIIPFVIGAGAMGACALLYQQGKAATAILYFIAGLALVYGMLAMFAVPLQLAVLGTCESAQPCAQGVGPALTPGEGTGIGLGAAAGIISIFVGFFGLAMVFRRRPSEPATPPVRKIPPMPAHDVSKPAPAKVAAVAGRQPELELPAPEELPELPAHESSASS